MLSRHVDMSIPGNNYELVISRLVAQGDGIVTVVQSEPITFNVAY